MIGRLFEEKKPTSPLTLLLNDHLNKYYNQENPLKITLLGEMADDGSIGDFTHLSDISKFYKKHYEKEPIQFQTISIVNDRLPRIKDIYKDQLPESLTFIERERFGEEKKAQSQKMKDQDGIINVSCALDDHAAELITLAKPESAFVQSICEYHHEVKDEEAKDVYVAEDVPYIYDEIYMGATGKGKGIKINENIQRLSSDEQQKPSLLDSISKKGLLETLLNKQSAQEYLKSHSIACGYMQNQSDMERFILTAANATTKKHIDMVLSVPLVSAKRLNEQGISVEFVRNSGAIALQSPVVTDEKKQETVKSVRLIYLSGTTEADKEKWMGLSDCVAASGDTSFSELISSRKFPVIAPYYKNGSIQEGIISELENKIPKPTELIHYLKITVHETEKDILKVCEYAREHYDVILKQWQAYCDEVIEKRNVANYLPTMVDNVIIASIFRKGEEKEMERLLTIMPEWKIEHTNFIFLAINSNNTKAIDLMVKLNPERFVQLMQEKHPSQEETPYNYAIKAKKGEMALKLLDLMNKLAPAGATIRPQ